MAEKLRAFFKVVAHTLLSFIAAFIAGCALNSFLRPILGTERYHQFAQTPVMIVLLLTGIALGGVQVFRRWPDRRAFFAWVLPAIWVLHLILSRGMAAMEGKWSDPFFLLGAGASYSFGALMTAIITKKFQSPPAESP